MRTRVWCTSLILASLAVACGDQPTEVVPEREIEMTQGPGIIALATSSSDDGLSITTDKDDYQPGDTVWFTGAGWPANDTLDILLEDEPATHEPHTWTIPVGEDGTFRDSTYVVDVNDIGVMFTLTATSRSTDRWLTVQFTDGTISNASLSFFPGGSTTSPATPVGAPPTGCTGGTGTSVQSGTVICAVASFTITGMGGTPVSIRWLNPSGSVVAVSARASNFGNGVINAQTFAAAFTPGVAGLWSAMICESSNTATTGSNASGCPTGAARDTATFTVTSAAPTKLAFPNTALTGIVEQCLGPITVQTQNASSAATNVTSNTTVTLATDGPGGFYSDNACTTSSATLTIASGANSGTFYYKATSPGDGSHSLSATADGLTSASQTQTINDKTAQTIDFPAVGPFTFAAQPTFSVAATASSGLTVSFASQTTTKCTVSGTTVTIVEAGTCTIRASQAGNGTYNPAPNVDQNITINKADQTISFPAVGPFTFGDPPFTVAATATSELTVSFATQTAAKCTVSGTTVTIVEAGTCTIRASQAGNVNYNAADDFDRSITIAKAPTTTVVASSDPSTVYGEPVTFTATVSSPASGLSGTVTFKDGSSVLGTGTLGCAATCTASLTTGIEDLTAGTHSITAVYGGSTNFLGSTSAAISQVVSPAGTTTAITSSPLSATYGDASLALQASVIANSPSQATVSEGTVVFTVKQGATVKGTVSGSANNGSASASFALFGVDAGSYSIEAVYQPASSAPNFLTSSDPSPEPLTIARAPTETLITSIAGAPFILNGTVTVTFSVALENAGGSYASDPTGTVQVKKGPDPLPCSVTLPGTDCSFAAGSIGDYSLTANYGGDGNYLPSSSPAQIITVKYNFDGFYAPVDRPTIMNISKAGQAIPLKWRLTDANNVPVTNLSDVTVKTKGIPCSAQAATDAIEEYAGASGLINHGDGSYQFNWKTPASYSNTCKTIELVFGTGSASYTEGPHAYFTFKK